MISFFRGDTYSFKFQRKRNGQVIEDLPKQIYFSVKDNYYTKKLIFQKKLNEGIVKQDDNYYVCTINPDDTDGLDYVEYNYDIEVVTDTYKKTIASGLLNLKKETTFVENEVE